VPASSSGRLAAIALHDVAPDTWPLCERLLDMIFAHGRNIPVTLLIVPQWHRRTFIHEAGEWRARIDALLSAGCEIALHGFWHVDEGGASGSLRTALARRVLSAGEAEFAAIDAEEARARIERGLDLIQKCGWPARGFVPPAWQISRQAAAVLGEFPFEYTTSLGSVTHIPGDRKWSVPCLGLSARSALRRGLSGLWIKWRLAQLANAPVVRVALHPLDAHYDSTRALCDVLLEHVLRDRQPVTKSALCRALLAGSVRPDLAHLAR
jgi:uncharacterized protein